MSSNYGLSYGMALADIKAARSALDVYEKEGLKEIKGLCAYHIQQAFEKMIKIQLYESGKKLNNARIYKHSIQDLIDYGQELNIELVTGKYLTENAEIITDWEATGRYDLSFTVKVTTLKKALSEAESLYETLNPVKQKKKNANTMEQ